MYRHIQKIDATAFECVQYRVSDHVATVRLNRPERRNALNWRAYAELGAAFQSIQNDPEVRCVIVTGTDPAFCSGDDVKEIMAGPNREKGLAHLDAVHPDPTPEAIAVLHCDCPVIAAVNGPAMGWGMELALFADIRIASERAQFAELFIKRGLVCDIGGLARLPAIVGPSRAAELLFTGDPIDAKTAAEIGLVSRVVPHERLLAEANALAKRIAVNPPLALRQMKEGLRRARGENYYEIGSWVASTLGRLFKTADHKEGVAAFLEKREPRFTGR